MTIELASLPLAAAAGALGILSPCVWPLVPVVMSSAAGAGRAGPWMLTGGLTLSFALAGTLLSLVLVSAGLDPELFRYVAGTLLVALGLVLVWRPLAGGSARRSRLFRDASGLRALRPAPPGVSSASAGCSAWSGCPASARRSALPSASHRWGRAWASPS